MKMPNYLSPILSLRVNPSDMKSYKNENRKISNDNLADINRLGLIDTLDRQNLTLGLDYKKEKIDNINRYFELKLELSRTKSNDQIPSNIFEIKNSNFW